MRPLEASQRVLTWLCVYPTDESTSRWEKVAYLASYSSVLLGIIGNLAASALYFVEYLQIDSEKSFYAVSQMAALACVVYIMGIALLLRHRIVIVFDGLAKIYEECNYLAISEIKCDHF